MSNLIDAFDPEAYFSAGNPFFKSVQATHSLFADAFEKTARLQLAFGEELLDLNRKRFDSLYAGNSVKETLAAQQEILVETGQRAAALADSFKQVVSDFQDGVKEAADEWVNVATEAASKGTEAPKAKKAKAA